ncbi:MAG TPA: sigma-54 dependent transcriptional regulator, partial [Terriglobales bacterium]|nr:sigma-54 dependent transcriptional regulator [Terriglobales bacterium]
QVLEIDLRKNGHKVEVANSKEDAKRKISSNLFDVVVTDIRMPSVEDGMEVMRFAREISPDSAVILMTAEAAKETAIQAIRAGAFDYVEKHPRVVDELRSAIARGAETVSLRRQNKVYRRESASRNSLDKIIGSSAALDKLKQTIRTIAATTSTVVVHGESGTGKELVARALHECSPRADEPFVSINCGAFPETLLESELFGYVKGAFTGANSNRVGLFEAATGGTIFLDEIGEMSVAMQVKLLRVLQEMKVRPVGGSEEIAIDVRVIAATNRDLQKMVEEKAFREDLFYRISVIPIEVPPLRHRRDDIPLLANHFLKKFAPIVGREISRIERGSLERMIGYDWPGNVRQLENAMERAVALETTNELHVELPERQKAMAAAATNGASSVREVPADGVDFEGYIADIERSLIQSALKQANGVQTRAADLLKVSYRSFRHLVKKYDI